MIPYLSFSTIPEPKHSEQPSPSQIGHRVHLRGEGIWQQLGGVPAGQSYGASLGIILLRVIGVWFILFAFWYSE